MAIINNTPVLPGYQVGEKLYAGSKTLVHRGIREEDSREVVIKFLACEYSSFNELLLFRNQYAIAKNLNFTGIVSPLSLEVYGNSYALVMEDFGGISLREYKKNFQGPDLICLTEFLSIAIKLTDILYYLYQNRIIHKDIKPANILIHSETKQVKLIDFSIASLLPRETQEIKSPNVLEGTLAYLSPEQTGRMNRAIDYRSDFYSLGVTFYELLTGQLPFISDDPMELVHCHIAKKPKILEDREQIPQVISDIVMKLMAKNAEDRYQSALGLKHDLEKCLYQIKETGKIEDFQIAQRDLCDRFIIPEKLYGRTEEVKALLEAFNRVSGAKDNLTSSQSEMILVAGFSGIGKTAIVNEVHKPIVRGRGYFIKGKFDQFNRNIPLSAFVQAFRDFMRQLLSESDVQLQEWKHKILQVLGDNGQVLIDVIPELEQIIGKQSPFLELSGTAAQNRFNLLFQKFLQVFTTKEHPLVIFLDDLQWADSASLKLMQLLMSESSGYLLLIGAYRDNEVSSAHPLMLTLEDISKANANICTITLAPLSQTSLNQLVADTLSCGLEIAKNLTQLIYQKTQGNPFFSTQFLKSLHEDKLIIFDPTQGGWVCNITEVKALALTDDVVEFMALQLHKLPEATQNVLKLAACIGNQFDLETLAIISEKSEIETATSLWKALQEGLILPTNEVYKFYVGQETQELTQGSLRATYKFLHDRVQQAAYSLIPTEQKQTTHLQIGQLLLNNSSASEREERLFDIVNHLNVGASLLSTAIEHNQLAQLNLAAAQKAKTATAYIAAANYANQGIYLLKADPWQQQYNLALALYEVATETAFFCGDFEKMEEFAGIILTQAKSPLEKVKVYETKILTYGAQHNCQKAIQVALEFMKLLDIHLIENPTKSDVELELEKTARRLAKYSSEELMHLPEMTEAPILAVMRVLSSLLYSVYSTEPRLAALTTLKQVNLSLEHGNTSLSAYAYAVYGLLLIELKEDIESGYQFGKLAQKLLTVFPSKEVSVKVLMVFHAMIQPWKEHINATLVAWTDIYSTALEVGDLEFAALSLQNDSTYSYFAAQELSTLQQKMATNALAIKHLKHEKIANYFAIYYQTILNLLGQGTNLCDLVGKAYDEVKQLPLYLKDNDVGALLYLYACKLLLCCLFANYSQALVYTLEAEQYTSVGGPEVLPVYFYGSLARLAVYFDASESKQLQIIERVTENQAKMKKWATHAPMNYLHKYQLVEAEQCRVLGNKAEAIELYDRAIAGAKTNGYIQEEALALELAAKFYLDWGKEEIAQTYMQSAYYCYGRWGAKTKIDDLEKRYPQLLQPILQQKQLSFNSLETITKRTIHSSTQSSSTSACIALDFATILKATQALSSEIQLEKLLSTLMLVVMENAGAQKAALLLIKNDTLMLEAIATTLEGATLPSIRYETSVEIPTTVINYVKRSLKTVVLDDATAQNDFIADPYLIQSQPKSVLSTPIFNQGQLIGLLYLENKLTIGAFTPERLEVIQILCTQAAISLENARLYQQAQQAQLQIVQSEKMSALGNLVAGVAHEMNNPLAFIAATLKQTKPTISDIKEHLKLYQKHLNNPVEEIIEHAEEIDLEYSLEDLPKMIDTMTIACDRLKNISTSLRTFSRADKDYKVLFNIHSGIDSTILILKHRLKASEQRPEIKVVTQYGNIPEIECFPGQLNQVFMNILANAIDALDESNSGRSFVEIQANPNRITITTSVEDNQVKINIADNAKGMTQEIKQKIFEHLFTTKAVGKGTGLGLAIAKQIVEETHGGKLSCNSVLGEGTEFRIQIPV